jgi:hypothetical protein
MRATNKAALLLLLAGAACAGAGGARGPKKPEERFFQADQKLPGVGAFGDLEGAAFKDALSHKQRGDIARENGNQDQARAEWATAADGLVALREKYGVNEYQIPVLFNAALLYRQADRFEQAAHAAERVATDQYAADKSKALAYRLAAETWLNAANEKMKVNQLEPIRLPTVEQRAGKPLAPRVPPGEWKRFVDAVDKYLPVMAMDPDLQRPVGQRQFSVPPAKLALIAAEVEYGFDDMEEAQRRFAAILEKWPSDADTLVAAVPLYLQTFQVRGDQAGYQAALAKVKADVDAQAQKATDEKDKAAFTKVKEALARADAGSRFGTAQKLLDEGKAAEAAQAFEQLAAEGGGDVAGALHNAALAWDKAGDGEKANGVRKRIVAEYPDAKVTPNNVLLMAAFQSKKGDHGEAARLYESFAHKYADSPNRCLALQNWAAELDTAKKPNDAAERYLAFGKDEACQKADPNFAARALYRSGQLFTLGKKTARAKEAFTAAVAVPNVTDTVAKSQVEDARKRLGK